MTQKKVVEPVKPDFTENLPDVQKQYDALDDEFGENIELEEDMYQMESLQYLEDKIDPRCEEWSHQTVTPQYFAPVHQKGLMFSQSHDVTAQKLADQLYQKTVEIRLPPEEHPDYFDGVEPKLRTENPPRNSAQVPVKNENCFALASDISMTYLGKEAIKDPAKMMQEQSFSVSTNCTTLGNLFDFTPVKVLVDTGATKCFISTHFVNKTPLLKGAPKIPVVGATVKIGDGRVMPLRFVVPVMVIIQGHAFEIFCLAADLGPTNEIVMGLKGLAELEAIIDLTKWKVRFMDRALWMWPKRNMTIPHGGKKSLTVSVPFSHELSGIAVAKIMLASSCYTLQVSMVRNEAVVNIVNTSGEDLVLNVDKPIGMLDARSMGFFNIDHQTLQHQLIPKYNFRYMYQEELNMMEEAEEETKSQASEGGQDPPQPDPDPEPDPEAENLSKLREKQEKVDPYPWLEDSDPRKHMSDEEILDMNIQLEGADLTDQEKKELMDLIKLYKKAFSLRDEIGECPNLKIEIEVVDDSPFFVRPFRISEDDKPIMDKGMRRLVALGILSKNTTSHTSPVMLVSRKMTKDKRPIVDFRLLNTRILRRNTATPLMKDIRAILGNSDCEIFSCLDLKDAYHSIPLTERSKEFCGIMPYFGSPHYRYEVLPMGLNISPAKWMEYVEVLLEHVENRHNFIVIMDDMLIHSTKKKHFQILSDLFKSLIRCGLKLSPKKCFMFRKKLVYMGNDFEVTESGVTMSVIKSRVEAIKELPPPKTPRQCKRFCGVVNYLAEFCPNLQRELRPIYELTRKNRPFIWTEVHQIAFEVVKDMLVSPPVLACPTSTGRYTLFTDTSRQHVGSCLWQRQKCRNRLIGYGSKTLQPACQNYGVTELEMHGMVVSIKMWALWLGKNEFDCVVDHQAIVHIMKSKEAPATDRIKKFLESLTNFNAMYYYLKGKDMLISDFLSRAQRNTPKQWEITPVGFDPRDFLVGMLKNEEELLVCQDFPATGQIQHSSSEAFHITTRRQAAEAGDKIPEVHGANKPLDPHLKPEHQDKSQLPQVRTHRGQLVQKPPSVAQQLARKAVKRSVSTLNKQRPPPVPRKALVDPDGSYSPVEPPSIPEEAEMPRMEPPKRNVSLPKPGLPKPNIPQQVATRKPQGAGYIPTTPKRIADIDPIPTGLEPDGPFDMDDVQQNHRTPKKSDFELPPALSEKVNVDDVTSRYLPKQVDLESLLKDVQKKVLRQVHLPLSMKDMEGAYLASPYFKDIYVYLAQNRVPSQSRRAQRVNASAFGYLLIDKLLFKVEKDCTGELVAKLCIPDSKIDMILHSYHSTVLGGHQGVTKTTMTLRQIYFCPRLSEHVQAYILGCHVCQMFKKGKQFQRPFLKRIHQGAWAFSRISMDIKYMPSSGPYKFLLVILCEISNYINCIPLTAGTAEQVCSALVEGHFKHYAPPQYLMCDKDPAFMSKLLEALFKHLEVKVITVGPTNHQSLQAEHGIKSISHIITKNLAAQGGQWHKLVPLSQLAYNAKVSPNMDGLSPYQLVFGHPAYTNPAMKLTPEVEIPTTHRQYYSDLVRKLKFYKEKLIADRDVKQDLRNKDKEFYSFQVGDLVYLYEPRGATLQTGSKKITCNFVGPLVIYKAISQRQFFLMSLDGLVYPHIIEETRIKPGYIYTSQGIVRTLAELKKVLRAGISPSGVKALPQ